MSDSPIPSAQDVDVVNRARRLAGIGYAALGLAATYFWFTSPWLNPLLIGLNIGIAVLGVVPILRWLQRGDEAYPLPELMQLTMVPFYAVPLLTGHDEVRRYPEEILVQASAMVVLFQLLCLFGAILVDRRHYARRQPMWWTDALVSDDSLRFSGYAFIATTAWLAVSSFSNWIPRELYGTLRAIFFGVGTISAFVQARLWGAGQLQHGHKALFLVNVLLQFILMNLSLVLVTSMIMLLLIFVGYFSAARRLPWLVCALAISALAVLHNGKHQMRDQYWGEHGRSVEFGEVPAFYTEWIEHGLAPKEEAGWGQAEAQRASLLDRASLIQLVCYALDTVPDRTPFLYGETYGYVPPQVIPRFLWPNKPSPNDSVKLLSVRLGMLTAEQAETTSIGYGLLTESYVNFGLPGAALLGLCIGWALRTVARRTELCDTLSGGGIFRILCLAWCLNAETTMAVWLSSFYQACIAIFVPIIIYASFSK